MVRLYTDHPAYFNDISDEIRLFAGRAEIEQAESAPRADVCVTLTTAGPVWRAEAMASIGGNRAAYSYNGAAIEGSGLVQKRFEKRYMKIAAFRAMREIYGIDPPWGSLTGIRPTRLFRELASSKGENEAARMFREEFDVSQGKLSLAREICAAQAPILKSQESFDVDVYINIPFCASKCLYCSFPSEVRTKKTDMRAYLMALYEDVREGARILRESGRRVRAAYFGGGTPTVLTEDELREALEVIPAAFGGFNGEFTIEAGRPDTITAEKLKIMKAAGVSRISVNPQSMNDATLALIGRSHGAEDVQRAFHMAREAGFDNINMDVIAGLPGEDEGSMENTLEKLSALSPESLTVHTLALKRSSRLLTEPGTYKMPGAETVERMVAMGEKAALSLSMRPYYMYRQKYMSGNLENVGYVLPGRECVYNIDMMEDTTTIMASGAGSMTKCVFDAERRVERVPAPKEIAVYIAKLDRLAKEKERLFGLGEGK